MKKSLLALALVACTPASDPPDVPIDAPIDELPAGVWEPTPGAWIWDASLAADNGTVWWTYIERRVEPGDHVVSNVWLAATTSTGAPRIEPSPVDPGSDSIYSPDVVVTPSAIVVATRGSRNVLRRFDRSGSPLGEPKTIVIDDGGRAVTNIGDLQLIATADGGTQLVAPLLYEIAEVAMVGLDAAGAPTRTVLVGAPDTTEQGGSTTNGVAAAALPDGSTIVAWDRNYNGCISTRPAATLTASVDGANVGAIQNVRDIPDRSERLPAVAAAGATAYIAWQGDTIAFAKYPDVATVLAEVGDPNGNSEISIVLADPGRGVIAWRAEQTGALNVVAFTESGGSVLLGSPRVVSAINPLASTVSVGVVHVGDDRYVLGWIERYGMTKEHLYATELDFANEALRPAPPVEAKPSRSPRTTRRALPCP